MQQIRKIAVGGDYKNAMHFSVGQKLNDGEYNIHAITRDDEMTSIWIENKDKEVFLYKEYNKHMPISFEYNINF